MSWSPSAGWTTFAVLALLSFACGSPPPKSNEVQGPATSSGPAPRLPRPLADAGAASNTPAVDPRQLGICVRLQRDHVPTIRGAAARGVPDEVLQTLMAPPCASDLREAWALLPSAIDARTDVVGIEWQLVFAREGEAPNDAITTVARSWRTSEVTTRGAGAFATARCRLDAFDYDNDATPEAFPSCTDDSPEMVPLAEARTRSTRPGRLWKVQSGAIGEYRPAASFDIVGLRDVDGDGRPDLEYVYFRTFASTLRKHAFAVEVTSPRLVAHALADGSFSTADEIARGAARLLCHAPPKRPWFAGSESVHEVTRRLACARMWGMTKNGALSTLAADCAAYWNRPDAIKDRSSDPCTSPLLDLYAGDVPIVLR